VGSADLRRALPLAAACALALAVAAGCGQTTQDQNQRLGLRAKRTVESRTPVVVKQANPDVEVVRTAVLRGDKESAVAVTLRNTGAEVVNDLPIVVGVRGSGGEQVLNSTAETPYFQAHAPLLAPGDETTWVYLSKSDPGDGDGFAKVGKPAEVLAVAPGAPELEVSHKDKSPKKGPTTLKVEVSNPHDFPQYDLEVYAWAEKGNRIVAAGRGVLEHISSNASADLTLTLVGDADGSEIQVNAPATFFE
jgi:hypothetical protein